MYERERAIIACEGVFRPVKAMKMPGTDRLPEPRTTKNILSRLCPRLAVSWVVAAEQLGRLLAAPGACWE